MSMYFKVPACAILLAATAAPAQATTTFAQFLQVVPSARIFTYTNTNTAGSKAKLGTVAGSNTVLISDIGTLASPALAKINLVGNATALPTVGTDIFQLFSGTITFTLLTPQIGMSGLSTNALTVTFVDAALLAAPGASAPTLQSGYSWGSTVSYASDFADLSSVDGEDFSLSFSGSSVPLSLIGSRLPNFRVSGSGTFAAVEDVPEPASWCLMLAGFGAIGSALRARRRMAISFS